MKHVAYKEGKIKEYLLGQKYAYPCTYIVGDDLIPSDGTKVIDSIIELYSSEKRINEELEKALFDLMRGTDYEFCVSVMYIQYFNVDVRKFPESFNIDRTTINEMLKQVDIRKERIRQDGIILFNGKNVLHYGTLMRTVEMILSKNA